MEIFFQTPKVMYVAKFRRIFHDPRGLLIVPLQERIKENTNRQKWLNKSRQSQKM